MVGFFSGRGTRFFRRGGGWYTTKLTPPNYYTAFSPPPKSRPPHLGGQCSSCRSIQPKPGNGSLIWYENPTPMGLNDVFQACNGGFAPCFGVTWRFGVQGVGVKAISSKKRSEWCRGGQGYKHDSATPLTPGLNLIGMLRAACACGYARSFQQLPTLCSARPRSADRGGQREWHQPSSATRPRAGDVLVATA